VETFDDIPDLDTDPGSSSADPAKAYRLIVTASDLTNRRLAHLPTDFVSHYPLTAGDPKAGARSVAEAVRCSMSIPFFYEPRELEYVLNGRRTKAVMVDGGLLSNFPIDVFDRTDEGTSRWPTFGIKLSALPDPNARPPAIHGPVGFAKSLLDTLMGFVDRAHIEDPKVLARTIFIDTSGVSATDFDLVSRDEGVRKKLYDNGHDAMTRFLDGDGTSKHPPWSFDDYKRMMKRS
jgi:NTE family protein